MSGIFFIKFDEIFLYNIGIWVRRRTKRGGEGARTMVVGQQLSDNDEQSWRRRSEGGDNGCDWRQQTQWQR